MSTASSSFVLARVAFDLAGFRALAVFVRGPKLRSVRGVEPIAKFEIIVFVRKIEAHALGGALPRS